MTGAHDPPGATGPPAAFEAGFDTAAFEALYRRLERPVYNVVYRWLWHREDAHDVVQEAFVRLWRMRDRVRPATVEPLVYRIAINLACNRRRAAKLRALVGLDRVAERLDPTPGAERALLDRSRERAVRAAVERLPEKLRRVVFLCAFSELGYAQIGEVLGLAPGTVASRRHAGLARLEVMLGDEGRVP